MAITRLSNNSFKTPKKGDSVRNGSVIGPFWNAATGGTTSDISNYNGTGETWRLHTISSNTTFTVTSSIDSFRILLVGGGGGGNGDSGCCACQQYGGGGSVTDLTGQSLPPGEYTVDLGSTSGGGWAGGPGTGATARILSPSGIELARADGRGGGSVGPHTARGYSTITGSNRPYAAGGGGTGCGLPARPAQGDWGNGNPGASTGGSPPGYGGASRVWISYRIG